jgi:hypothetical protein
MYPFLFLGDDGAVGAGVAAGTAVQAAGSIDDVLVITLADSTSGASVRAGAAAHAGRSDFVSHGKHLHKICSFILAHNWKIARENCLNCNVNFCNNFRKVEKMAVCST